MSPHLARGPGSHLLHNASGHLTFDCGGEEPTCDIACSELASAYTVLGVGSLTGCAGCTSSDWAPWNGVVQQVDDICRWMLNEVASIDGKFPSYSLMLGAYCADPSMSNGVGLWFNTATCLWELVISCRDIYVDDYLVIWAGTKSVEFSPAGVYTRVCGCDETPTFTVV